MPSLSRHPPGARRFGEGEGLTLAERQDIGCEAAITPEFIRRAAPVESTALLEEPASSDLMEAPEIEADREPATARRRIRDDRS